MSHWTGPLTVDFIHMAFMARAAWQSQPSTLYVTGSSPPEPLYVVFRLLCAVLVGNPAFTAFLNIALLTVRVYLYVESTAVPRRLGELPMNVYDAYEANAFTMFVFTEMFVVAAAVLASWTLQASTFQEASATLQAKVSSRAQETINALLSLLCDAVVPTTLDFTLTTPSLALAGFLLRRPLNNTYEGSNLMQFIDEQDRGHMARQFSSCSNLPGTTASVLARVVDGNGSRLAVRMYCTRYTDAMDRDGFMIGVLDDRQNDDFASAAVPPASDVDSRFLVDACSASILSASPSEDRHVDSCSQSGSVATSDTSSLHIHGDCDSAMEVCVDFAEKHLPVCRATMAFMLLAGPTNCSSLHDWFSKADLQEVTARVQAAHQKAEQLRAYVAAAYGREASQEDLGEEAHVTTLTDFRLQPKFARKCRFFYEVKGVIKLVLSESPSNGLVIVRIQLTSVTVKRPKRRRKRNWKRSVLQQHEWQKLAQRAMTVQVTEERAAALQATGQRAADVCRDEGQDVVNAREKPKVDLELLDAGKRDLTFVEL
eukprot:TRINITY_DN6735_c0_g1_i4.p1 TRINITY_DN6735_c0_g1~~TRINITY_DN6735_c0_g1_i4.p1  ORF type:complete len:607 (-),score=71.28 TRINITY_DN6735_c0_g1_i4:453-2075(-)